jgi:pyrimidine-nucleoside phosphorylase
VVREVVARQAGYVGRLGAIAVGATALHLGAGRVSKEDEIDHAVGVICQRKRGDAVEEGDVLAEVHARDDVSAAAGVEEVLAAYEIGDAPPAAHPLVLDVLA